MTHSTTKVHQLLNNQMQIAVIWSVEDVQSIRPDLTAQQAWEVLQFCRKAHDACVGINWEVLEASANILFPES